jgi:hypothetical protein
MEGPGEAWKNRPHLKLVSLLGKCQFGGVYRAMDRTDGIEYAVKITSLREQMKSVLDLEKRLQERVLEHSDTEEDDSDCEGDCTQPSKIEKKVVIQFLLEVQQMNRVSSENVVRSTDHWIEGPRAADILSDSAISGLVHKVNSDDSDTFLYNKMELCDTTLESWLEHHDTTGQSEKILMEVRNGALLQMTLGLHCLHKAGIVHCDLKPDNILLRVKEGKIAFKISDLGNSEWSESDDMDFQRKVKEDVELLAKRVFKIILQNIEQVKNKGEFYWEKAFVECIENKDKVYFRDCSCTTLIQLLAGGANIDAEENRHTLEDQHKFEKCYRCIYDYWSIAFVSKYENIELCSDLLELRSKIDDQEVFRYQIKVDKAADARYYTTMLNGCLKTTGLKVVAVDGKKFLELNRNGLGNSSIDYLRDTATDLLVLFCCSADDSETYDLTDVCEQLDSLTGAVNTLVVTYKDMKGKNVSLPSLNWKDLTKSSRIQLLKNKMKLQGKMAFIGDYLKELDSDCLRLVLSDSKGELNIPLGPKSGKSALPKHYIDRKFQVINSNEELTDTEVLERCRKLALISDGPGTGKSTVLIQLCQSLSWFEGTWGHIIHLNRYLCNLLEWNTSATPVETLLLQMVKENLQNDALQSLFETTLQGTTGIKLVLFLDALDEVTPDSYDIVVNLITRLMEKSGISKIVLTSRPHLFTELQNSFTQMLCVQPDAISYEEQCDYMMAVWGVTDWEHEELVSGCLHKFSQLITFDENSPLESPLLLSMLAEHTKNGKQLPGTIHEFYSAAVDMKLEASIEEKFGIKCEGLGVGAQTLKEGNKIEIAMCLEWLALQIVHFEGQSNSISEVKQPDYWNEDKLRRTLLVEGCGRNIFFVHRTFAEYFFGLYLANSIHNLTPEQMAELAFSPAMQAVRNLFDFSILRKYFTHQRSVTFWNAINYSPDTFEEYCQVYLESYLYDSPWEAVLLRSILEHCDKDTTMSILLMDNRNALLRKNMGEWQWSLKQLGDRFGSQLPANIFFRLPAGEHVNTLWNTALFNIKETGSVMYARILWEWLRSDSCTIEKAEKVELLLRGEGNLSNFSFFICVGNANSFEFFTEVLTELSLPPEKIREELLLLRDATRQNWLHFVTPVRKNATPISRIRQFAETFLSNEDFASLIFEGMF